MFSDLSPYNGFVLAVKSEFGKKIAVFTPI